MFKYSGEVRGYELDSYGHVNNSVYMNYTEQARWLIFKESGLLTKFTDQGLKLVVIDTHIRYIRELKLFDLWEVYTDIELESPYLLFKHTIKNKTKNLKSAISTVKTLLIDKDKIPVDFTEELLNMVMKYKNKEPDVY